MFFASAISGPPDFVAYTEYDGEAEVWRDYTWAQMDRLIARWQAALKREPLHSGDRVAIMLRNSCSWVALDQAAMGLGLGPRSVVFFGPAGRPLALGEVVRGEGELLLARPHVVFPWAVR